MAQARPDPLFAGLAKKTLDGLAKLPSFRICTGYEGMPPLGLPSTLAEQEALTLELSAARPSYRDLSHQSERALAFRQLLEERSRIPVGYEVRGRTAHDVHERVRSGGT